MVHPASTIVGVYDDDLEDWLGPSGEKINSMQFYETDTSRGFVRGCRWILWDGAGPLHQVARLTMGEGMGDEPFWGEPFARRLKGSAGHTIAWVIVPEDLPEESNRVTLDPVLKDSDGLPAPKINYTISDNTQRMIGFNCARALEAHMEAGATSASVFIRYGTSGHLLGTARMGDDPETSVLNRYGRAHDVPNLYVVDGSVFVTGFGVNPTSTICALAKRTATHIVEHAREQEVAS
jgi:choline dehydrogenase-like flavoprotein